MRSALIDLELYAMAVRAEGSPVYWGWRAVATATGQRLFWSRAWFPNHIDAALDGDRHVVRVINAIAEVVS